MLHDGQNPACVGILSMHAYKSHHCNEVQIWKKGENECYSCLTGQTGLYSKVAWTVVLHKRFRVFIWEDHQFGVVNIQNKFVHRLCCSVVKAEIEPGYEQVQSSTSAYHQHKMRMCCSDIITKIVLYIKWITVIQEQNPG